MQQRENYYSVVAEVRAPDFASERRFVEVETAFAKRKLGETKDRDGLKAVVARVAGEAGADDWKHYLKALDHYLAKLNDLQAEVAGGLVPFKFFVANDGDDDKNIRIHLRIEHGSIHRSKQAPARPARVDGGPAHVPAEKPKPATIEDVVSGFERRGVKIGPHSIEAEFSELEAGDSADLVHEVLYIASGRDTEFSYEIRSKGLPEGVTGEVTA